MRLLFVVLSLSLCLTASAAEQDSINHEWILKHYTKREVMVPMRDGIRLFTTLYEPRDNSRPHPILLQRTCYGVAPYGERFQRFTPEGYNEYLRSAYIIVYQDVRGKNMSEGTFEDIRPYIPNKRGRQIDEASDTYDTAEWLIHNTHSNGAIGVHGISYPGFYSTMAALSQHPAIKAVSPQAPVTDWFRGDDDHHNGALCLMDMYSFEYWFQVINSRAFWEGRISRSDNPTEVVRNDVYDDYLSVGALQHFTRLLGDSIEMWRLTTEHPNLDDYWQTHTVTNYLQHIPVTRRAHPAVLVVGGLFDAEDCFGAFATYRAIRRLSPKTEAYLIAGPWSHGAWRYPDASQLGDIDYGEQAAAQHYMLRYEYPFFAYYLEGRGSKPQAGAHIFDSGSLRWRDIKEGWDPDTTAFTAGTTAMTRHSVPFYLSSAGRLSTDATANGATDTLTEYVSDPARPVPYIGEGAHTSRITSYMNADQRFASRRTDVATFTTDTLTDSVRVIGVPVVDFNVSISSTDADFIVKVIDVDDEGTQNLVRWEVMRGRYRDSFSDPAPFVPGQPTRLHFTMNAMSHTFAPGHRIMVQVQSSMFPLLDRNPQQFCNIYTCSDDDFVPATIRIHRSAAHPSRVFLPVVE